ncbi:DUF2798 domain-containing protein [Psychrobacter sp. CAL346-MNA-CIBAN-0220]|uniref:DUF2798 domain-containing protein n=1 Tax=Psychrobacter sp. CAL346-MNA-CIBAN-0220 TaxID=3140457 RepID=UPI0033346AD3
MNWKFRLLNTATMAILLSGVMTIYITYINLGMIESFIQYWLKAWLLAAPAAFICVLILANPVQKFTKKLLVREQSK